MAKIEDLITKRNQQYDTLTEAIVQMALDTTETICEFLVNKLDGSITSINGADLAYIEWDTIISKDYRIIFSGFLLFKVGTQIPFEDSITTVTEQNKSYFRYNVQLAIPAKLVNQKDKIAIKEFLQSVNIIQPDNTDTRESDFSDNEIEPTDTDNVSGFDINSLTKEQKEALKTLQYQDNTGVKN